MHKTENAVILVAGEGKRLRPFTLSQPKCLARVNGIPILTNALKSLAASGCRQVRIVVGHLAHVIRDIITDRFAGMTVEYIMNPEYVTTNSMYSLALGLEGLDSPTWVLEGDVFFEQPILNLTAPPEIAWFVDSATRQLDGAYVETDEHNQARSLQIIRDLNTLHSNQFKSIGILHLSRAGTKQVLGMLSEGITAGRQNDYYDLILGDHMNNIAISVVDVSGHRWFEIDTQEDLQNATDLFS